MGLAGQSARREYERRRHGDLQKRRLHYKWKLASIFIAPLLVFAVARAAFLEPFDGNASFLAGLLAFVVATKLASDLWGRKATTDAWRKGADGEELTARTLARLPAAYFSLHDLRIPGSRANIDHLVIGPSGVFTVETKHYTGDLEVRSGRAQRGGRSMSSVVDQAAGQAKVASDILGCAVRPIVCIQGGQVTGPLFSRPVVGKVRFCSDRHLNKVITSTKGALSNDAVIRFVDLANRGFGVHN
jgi:hypothetical protein